MAVVTRKERNARRNDALSKIEKGWGVGQTINYLVSDYKITRRSANLDIQWASAKLVQNLNKHERTDLLAWLLYQMDNSLMVIHKQNLNLSPSFSILSNNNNYLIYILFIFCSEY
jgi:hypothetical protein